MTAFTRCTMYWLVNATKDPQFTFNIHDNFAPAKIHPSRLYFSWKQCIAVSIFELRTTACSYRAWHTYKVQTHLFSFSVLFIL